MSRLTLAGFGTERPNNLLPLCRDDLQRTSRSVDVAGVSSIFST